MLKQQGQTRKRVSSCRHRPKVQANERRDVVFCQDRVGRKPLRFIRINAVVVDTDGTGVQSAQVRGSRWLETGVRRYIFRRGEQGGIIGLEQHVVVSGNASIPEVMFADEPFTPQVDHDRRATETLERQFIDRGSLA